MTISHIPRKQLRKIYLCTICLLALFCQAGAQTNDSLFEKVTVYLLKTDSSNQKIRDGQRQLYLHYHGQFDNNLKDFYYRYRNGLVADVEGDTLFKPAISRAIIAGFKSTGVYNTANQPFTAPLDLLINRLDSSIRNVYAQNEELKKQYAALNDKSETWKTLFIVMAIVAALLGGWAYLQKRKKKNAVSGSTEKTGENTEEQKPEESKKEISRQEKIKELKKSLDKVEEEHETLKKSRQEEVEAHEKAMRELQEKVEIFKDQIGEWKDNHETVSKDLEKITGEKNEFEKRSKELHDDYTRVHTNREDLNKSLAAIDENIEKLKHVYPAITSEEKFPDINNCVHSWFLLKDLLTGIKERSFSVLSTPNFSKWILSQDHTYALLDTDNKSANASIVNFCRELKKKGVEQISPDNSYIVLNNLKITQGIFDSLAFKE